MRTTDERLAGYEQDQYPATSRASGALGVLATHYSCYKGLVRLARSTRTGPGEDFLLTS